MLTSGEVEDTTFQHIWSGESNEEYQPTNHCCFAEVLFGDGTASGHLNTTAKKLWMHGSGVMPMQQHRRMSQ